MIRPSLALAPLGAAISLLLIGWLDYLTGIEFRIYPVYLLPISWMAWRSGVGMAAIAGVFASAIWIAANQLAGLSFSSSVVWAFNAAMHAGSFVFVAILLARLRKSLDRERELARRDPLTKLLNARAFEEHAERLLAAARRYRHPLTLAYVDLDDFKLLNDRQGHAAGDEVLTRVGEVLRAAVRDVDVAARLGGDEFVIVLAETGLDGARPALERIHASLTTAFRSVAPGVGASIGAVAFEQVPADLDAVVRAADRTMYEAKAHGKNRVTLVAGDR